MTLSKGGGGLMFVVQIQRRSDGHHASENHMTAIASVHKVRTAGHSARNRHLGGANHLDNKKCHVGFGAMGSK